MTITNNPFSRSGIFQSISDELDPPPDRIALARRRYQDLGEWLQTDASIDGHAMSVYPQGSYNLGTTNRDPFTDEFDLDLVFRVDMLKHQISQRDLNQKVGLWLAMYVADRELGGSEFAPSDLEHKKRAWTIHYADRFHMDILPVVPARPGEIDATGGDPSWLTDKELTRWQPTNPRGFVEHFRKVSDEELKAIAKRMAVEVEDLPSVGGAKTTLQMAVKIAKRHRDVMFQDDPEDLAPPSVLITALMTAAYQKATPSGGDLAEVLSAVAATMPDLLTEVDGELVVPNPTCPKENYADRYLGRRDKRQALDEWLKQLAADFEWVGSTRAGRMSRSIDMVFGEGFGTKVAKRLGTQTAAAKDEGRLRSDAAGTLSVGTAIGTPHRPHTFYGDHDAERSA